MESTPPENTNTLKGQEGSAAYAAQEFCWSAGNRKGPGAGWVPLSGCGTRRHGLHGSASAEHERGCEHVRREACQTLMSSCNGHSR